MAGHRGHRPDASCRSRGCRATSSPSPARRRGRAHEGAAHLPRGHAAPALPGLGYKAMAINEGLGGDLLRGSRTTTSRGSAFCGGGMCNVTLAFLSIPSIMASRKAATSSTLGRRGGRRARDAGEGDQGGGPRPLQGSRRTRWRRRSTSTTRTSSRRSSTRCAARSRRGEAAQDRPRAADRPRRRHREAEGLPRAVRADALRRAASRSRSPRSARPQDPLTATARGGPHRRHVREVVAPPVPAPPRTRPRCVAPAPRPRGPGVVRLLPAGARPGDPGQAVGRRYQEPAQRHAPAPNAGTNVRTYGLWFVDYLPEYYLGLCLLRSRTTPGPSTSSTGPSGRARSRRRRRSTRSCCGCGRRRRARRPRR